MLQQGENLSVWTSGSAGILRLDNDRRCCGTYESERYGAVPLIRLPIFLSVMPYFLLLEKDIVFQTRVANFTSEVLLQHPSERAYLDR